ncbi:Nif3-like dinuclear metal center hexameric protein [Mycolicibacterium sp.]|jgi:dinuclear metal center YbgI/SA1388 family protein|uniref:Nif3-like dinuclear metal center hexameric protein n=1 Tax=Mycolicibacterium sp. TaxID=2320850 RepID=UPI001A2362B2|nr:Nif3-like dinuclear metal center hexameric protein [Mycolicibacterium sp.]MBJ7399933.1 Nif3-like dinuclear metal center hexameric protein [Mycolicibacterium sp.]
MSVRLADIIAVLDDAYPPGLAQDWDSVGLVCGDPQDTIDSVTVAVDATAAVVDTVGQRGLLLAHHPLLLRGVDTVAASTPKGALIHRLIRNGAALFTAHTNADAASPGVSDALAEALGLTVEAVLEPASGGLSPNVGTGRIGTVARPQRFADFVTWVNSALPQTTWGVRAAGDADATVTRVAVCGGSGDSLLAAAAAAGVQAYVTADLRHHPADEHRRGSDVGLIDIAHWASEYPWCTQVAELLRAQFGAALPVMVCPLRTDPWNVEYPRGDHES